MRIDAERSVDYNGSSYSLTDSGRFGMHALIRRGVIASASVLLATAAPLAFATRSEYIYTGQPFTDVPVCCSVSRLHISFVVDDSAVPVNGTANLNSYFKPNIIEFHFSDGYQTLTADPNSPFGIYTSARITFDTDANRNIIGNWDASAGRAHGSPAGLILDDAIRTANLSVYGPTGRPFTEDSTHSLGLYTLSLANVPGIWVRVSAVPEPADLMLFSGGFAWLGAIGFRRRRREGRKVNALPVSADLKSTSSDE